MVRSSKETRGKYAHPPLKPLFSGKCKFLVHDQDVLQLHVATNHQEELWDWCYKFLFYGLFPPWAICGKHFGFRQEMKEPVVLGHPWEGLLELVHQALAVWGSSEGSTAPPEAREVGEDEAEASVLASAKGSRAKGLEAREREEVGGADEA